jgi:hypothetical protein
MSERVAPLTFRRRIEAAWETAQKFAELRQPSWPAELTFSERFDSVRQKLTSAMQP